MERWELALSFLYAAYAVVGYLTVYVIRQIWFHPLRKYPGPKLAAITIWYKAYYDLVVGGGWLVHIEELHQQYGPIIRVGPNEIHFTSSRAFHQIYAPGSKYPKEAFYYRGFNLPGTSFGETEPEPAKIRREMLAPLFSRRAILKLEPVIQEKVDLLVSELAKYDGKPANLYLAFRCTTIDIITSYCFAFCFDALKAPGFADPFTLSFRKAIEYFWFLKYFPFMITVAEFMTKWFGDTEISIGNSTVQKHIAAQVDLFLNNEGALENVEHEIIYHHLIHPQSEKMQGEPLSRKQLIEEGQVMLGAGSETVSGTVNFGVFRTLWDKRVLRNLCAELREAWPDKDQAVSYTTLEKLPYLTAVIKESLRFMPGAATPSPRVVTSDTVIDDNFVPKGTIVSTGQTFLHFNPDIFFDPHTFNPERWLQPDSSTLENYLVSFSRGPRMCLGINLAWCELYLLFGNVFRKLDMKIYETDPSDFKFKDIFMPIPIGRQFHAIVRGRAD